MQLCLPNVNVSDISMTCEGTKLLEEVMSFL